MGDLNPTAAISRRGTPADSKVERTVSARPLSGGQGFLVQQSTYNKRTGAYECQESFSPDAPRIAPAELLDSPRDAAGSRGMAAAVKTAKA